MQYKLYTTVDITHTGQYRNELGKETLRWKEQNFQTVLQTLGIRANILFSGRPEPLTVKGTVIGLAVEELVHAWRFDFETERDHLFESEDSPVGYLLDDFELVPYISGLDESMTQNYDIFVTRGPSRNISFYKNE
jgi:hypothetical protein